MAEGRGRMKNPKKENKDSDEWLKNRIEKVVSIVVIDNTDSCKMIIPIDSFNRWSR